MAELVFGDGQFNVAQMNHVPCKLKLTGGNFNFQIPQKLKIKDTSRQTRNTFHNFGHNLHSFSRVARPANTT